MLHEGANSDAHNHGHAIVSPGHGTYGDINFLDGWEGVNDVHERTNEVIYIYLYIYIHATNINEGKKAHTSWATSPPLIARLIIYHGFGDSWQQKKMRVQVATFQVHVHGFLFQIVCLRVTRSWVLHLSQHHSTFSSRFVGPREITVGCLKSCARRRLGFKLNSRSRSHCNIMRAHGVE